MPSKRIVTYIIKSEMLSQVPWMRPGRQSLLHPVLPPPQSGLCRAGAPRGLRLREGRGLCLWFRTLKIDVGTEGRRGREGTHVPEHSRTVAVAVTRIISNKTTFIYSYVKI